MNQFTQKSIEALRDTQSIALENGNQQIEQIHLLDALVSKEDGLIPNLVKQSGASIENIKTLTDQAISFLPKVSGVQTDKLYLSRELDAAFTEAEAQAKISKIAVDIQNEANIESLVKAKGFENCVAVISGDKINVIVASEEELVAAQVVQINEIVYETTGILPTNVKIIKK